MKPTTIIIKHRTVGFLRPCNTRFYIATTNASLDRLYHATTAWRATIDHAGVTHLKPKRYPPKETR